MAAGEIQRAFERFSDRVLAAAPDGTAGSQAEAEQAYRAILSGFDLDWSEVTVLMATAGFAAESTRGSSPFDAAASGCSTGLVIGLLIAEARQREGAAGD